MINDLQNDCIELLRTFFDREQFYTFKLFKHFENSVCLSKLNALYSNGQNVFRNNYLVAKYHKIYYQFLIFF